MVIEWDYHYYNYDYLLLYGNGILQYNGFRIIIMILVCPHIYIYTHVWIIIYKHTTVIIII